MILHTTIREYWFLFLVFFAGIGILLVAALIVEYFKKNDNILKLNPFVLVGKIVLLQSLFYMLNSFIIYAMDYIFQEVFYPTQIWSSNDFNFQTGRGWISIMGLILSMLSMCSLVLGLVRDRTQIRDHCFTISFCHFIIVSLAMLDFPRSGAWWFSIILGLLVLTITSEFISYQLELMPYKSHMAGKEGKKESKRGANVGSNFSAALRENQNEEMGVVQLEEREGSSPSLEKLDDDILFNNYQTIPSKQMSTKYGDIVIYSLQPPEEHSKRRDRLPTST